MRGLLPLILALVLLSVISGCSGGGGGGGGIDKTQIQAVITARITAFTQAVEDYDVDGMLGFLDKDNFKLTISEGDSQYSKTYSVLKAELEEDEAK